MARRIDTTAYTTFDEITARLDEIVTQVRRKDIPLESSLDLYDEAIALGSKAVDFVDTAPVTAEERGNAMEEQQSAAPEGEGSDGEAQ